MSGEVNKQIQTYSKYKLIDALYSVFTVFENKFLKEKEDYKKLRETIIETVIKGENE